MNLPKVNFGNLIYKECEGSNTYVHSYTNVSCDDFEAYINLATDAGFAVVSSYCLHKNRFATLTCGRDAVYLAYYPQLCEMRIVAEPDSEYLTFDDTCGDEVCKSLFTQVHLEDFGLSDVIRLSDKRFIVIDGGRPLTPDADRLMECLSAQSDGTKPVIAAWIMTHPHLDHYRCYFEFAKRHADEVIIERFIYNFPDACEENIEKIPNLAKSDEIANLLHFEKLVKDCGAPVYRAHTGQIYEFANAKFEVLSSPDDVFCTPISDINSLSLVLRMTIDGQVILITGDSQFECAKLGRRWGEYLKSDILQVPHHGFVGGAIYEYDLIDPSVCLVPVSAENCFKIFNIYEDYNRHLIYNLNVEDYYTDLGQSITLTLPYAPRANGKKILFDTIDEYQSDSGAKTWYFEGLTKADCDFTFINSTGKKATVYVDLLFDSSADIVRYIKLEAKSFSTTAKNIINLEDVDGDAPYFNKKKLINATIADDAVFTAHFKSDVPIVIKGGTGAVYYR